MFSKSNHTLKFLLFISVLIYACSDYNKFENTIKPQNSDAKKKKVWEGSPYVEWESSTFLNPLKPYLGTDEGILTWEGSLSDTGFQIEKAVLLNFKNGQTLWRHAYKPITKTVLENPLVIKSKFSRIPVLASWVDGDLFRIQNLKTGEDILNKPNCKYISNFKNLLFGYCMGRITVINLENNKKLLTVTSPIKPIYVKSISNYKVLLSDVKHNIYLFDLTTKKLNLLQQNKPIIYLRTDKKTIYEVYTSNDGVIFEVNILKNDELKTKWSVALSGDITNFWFHKTDKFIIYPTGMECISAVNSKNGSEEWTSCGVYEKTPPAWDNDGIYILSSRVINNLRPLIFIDNGNGMQTPLFQSLQGENSINPILAYMLTPGKAYHGMIYAVKNKSKIMAIRIAAPE